MTLGARFTFLMVAVMALTGGVLIGGFLGVERSYLLEEGRKAHQTDTNHLAHLCAESLVNRDELGLVNFLKEMRHSKDLKEAFCVDTNGTVLAHTDLSWMGRKLNGFAPPWKTDALAGEYSGDWVYAQSAIRNGQPVALARSIYSPRVVQQAVSDRLNSMVRRSMKLGAGVLCLALFLSWGTARALTQPIRKLALGVQRVGGGDWSARVDPSAPGELGVLAREFNVMSEKLGELDRLKDQFVAAVSHDLRNPLGAITASAKMLQEDQLAPRSRDQVDLIVSSVTRLGAMVSNILDIACLQEKALVFDVKPFSLLPLLTDLHRLYKPLAQQSKKKIELAVPPNLPTVRGDEEKVFRIFLNLIVNAFKFTRENDQIVISARASSPRWVECRVSDTGRGIPPERLPELFEPHRSRGKSDGDKSGQGAGLGLSIVKILVEGQGGTIRVESVPGQGSAFFFTIPVEESE